MKIKKVKKDKCFPYHQYMDRIKGISFQAIIFEDGGGEFSAKQNKEIINECDDGVLDEWIEETEEGIQNLKAQLLFLKKVKNHIGTLK